MKNETPFEVYLKHRILFVSLAIGAQALAISPFIVGAIGSALTPGCTNEGNCSWVALGWFGMLTIPVGGISSLVLFILGITNRKPEDKTPTLKSSILQRVLWCLIAIALTPVFFVMAVFITGDLSSTAFPLLAFGPACAALTYLIVLSFQNRMIKP